jgi:curli biogenesis system outer membrane secretion channel CsgG
MQRLIQNIKKLYVVLATINPAKSLILAGALICSFILLLTGCAAINESMEPTAHVESSVPADLPAYSGPKARISVQRFDVRAAKAGNEIGNGLRDMLATALLESNRFSVLERQELSSIMQEQELSASGAVGKESRIQRGILIGSDLMITGAVTEFEGKASGGGGGLGVGGLIGGVIGGIGATMNKAHIGIDLRIVNVATGEIIAAKKVVGEAKDANIGTIVGGFGGGVFGGAGLGMYKNTPMEKAIRICIGEAVKYLSSAVPPQYYKY